MSVKILTVIGARPQFIKAATVSRAIFRHNQNPKKKFLVNEIIVHTGQHYDENMSRIFFDELQIPRPHYNLGIGSHRHGQQTGKMLAGIEEVLIAEKPDLVLTYGDTNSTLAGALAAVKQHVLSAHIEAGLRSYNRRMPEEINRVLTDRISNILFCPTDTAANNLRHEGIVSKGASAKQRLDFNRQSVFHVGDVMYDSMLFNLRLAHKKSDILHRLGLIRSDAGGRRSHRDKDPAHDFCLATVHRPENTDNPENLKNILEALTKIAAKGIRVLLPLHPRTRKWIKASGFAKGLKLTDRTGVRGKSKKGCLSENEQQGLVLMEPVSYLDMLQLEKHAFAIFTDSGGIQKEAFFLGIPCVTLRNETEWIETVHAGWNILTGAHTEKIIKAFTTISQWSRQGPPFSITGGPVQAHPHHVFGDGKAAEKIVNILSKMVY